MTANVERWRDIVEREVAAQGDVIPVGLALAIIDKESGGVPSAYRGEPAIGDGSHGLMQLLYKTAQGLGYTGPRGDAANLSGLFDPATNIHYGVKFLTSLWRQLGNVADVASAYNGGYRPKLGFGRVYEGAGYDSVLARDPKTGTPITTRHVSAGEYANQPYVDKVVALTQKYGGAQGLPPVVVTGEADAGTLGVVAMVGVASLLAFALWKAR